MIARIFTIGSSHYIRLADEWLDRNKVSDTVDIDYRGSRIVIKSVSKPRVGWTKLYEASFSQEGWEPPLLPGDFGAEELPE